MIHYVIAVGSAAAVDQARACLGAGLEHTRYFDGDLVEASGSSRTWALAVVAAPDPICSRRLVARGDAAAVLNGPALRASADGRVDLDATLDKLSSGAVGGIDELRGSYNLAAVAPACGLRAFTDPSGLHPVYYAQGEGVAFVSNRSTTVAQVAGTDGWDLRALAWLIGHGNVFGDRMPARGVRYLRPGCELHAPWGSHEVSVRRAPTWVWPEPGEVGGRDDLTAGEWDDVTAGLVEEVRQMRGWGDRLQLALTGGKDSRLCLALASAAEMQGRVVAFTMGAPTSPEVEVAAAVAEAAGFEHERRGSRSFKDARADVPAIVDSDAVWGRLHQHAYRYDGIVSPWDGVNDPLRGTVLQIDGFGGELYRQTHVGKFRRNQPGTVDEMVPMFFDYHQPHDLLGLLRPGEVAFQRAWIEAWVRTAATEVRLDTVPVKFYVDYRLGHWNGPMGQSKPGRISANPLVSFSAVRKALELSPESRSSGRFHFEVMRRAAPRLVGIPFLADTWPDAIAASSPIDLPREPYPTTRQASGPAPIPWQMLFLKSEHRTIRRLFREADRHTDMGAVCDMRKLRRMRLATLDLKVFEARTVLSCISIAITLLGRAERVVDPVVGQAEASPGVS